MNIAGVVVRTQPHDMERVARGLSRLDGVEVHACHEEGRMVVTVESDDVKSAGDTVVALHDVPGVLAASLVYQQSE